MSRGPLTWVLGMTVTLALALARPGAAETLPAPALGEGIRTVRMFHDDGAGRPGAEAPDRRFPTNVGRVHIQVELSQARRDRTEIGWAVHELPAGGGDGVRLMERSSSGSGFASLTFNAARTPDWRPARYRIDLSFDGVVAQSAEFTVVRDPASIRVETIGLHQGDTDGQIGAPVSWFRAGDRRLFLRLVASGCGGVPLRARLAPLEGDAGGSPVAVVEEMVVPDGSRHVDLFFESEADWAPGIYRAEITTGDQVLASIDVRIE